jgi:hypothetical protein
MHLEERGVSVNMYLTCHNANVSVVCCVCTVDMRETIDLLVYYSTPAGQLVILHYIRYMSKPRNRNTGDSTFTLSLFRVASLIKVCFQKKRTSK